MFGAYYPATNADYVWDDDEHFTKDQFITRPDALKHIWLTPEKTVWNYWPVSRTSFLIELRLWGYHPKASHIVNILLHLAGVLLLYFGLRRFRVSSSCVTGKLGAAFPSSALPPLE